MADKKNVFESWVDSQNKSMENLAEATKKLQDSMMKGEVLKEGADIYKDWFSNQKSIMETVLKSEGFSMPTNGSTNDPSAWMKAQEEFAKKMMESMQQTMPMQSGAFSSPEDYLAQSRKIYDQWQQLYNQWFSQASKSFESMKAFMQGDTSSISFQDMMNTSQVYMKMYEVYQPIMKAMQDNMQELFKDGKFNPEAFTSLSKMYQPEKYKEAVDAMFSFASSDKFKEFYEKIQQMNQEFTKSGKEAQSKVAEQMDQFTKTMFNSANPQFKEFAENMQKQMEQLYDPVKKLVPAGKEKELMETNQEIQDKLATYWSKYTEMQYLVYVAAQKSLDKVLQQSMEKFRDGSLKEPMSYQDFFNQWLNTTEESITEMFNTDEFSKAQGELLKTGLEIKNSLEKQMEFFLSAYPVVPRSEADELAATVHDLKNRVRTLEKGGKEDSEEKKSSSTAKKSTASSASSASTAKKSS